VTKSVDESAAGTNLDEESEVIELTDEVDPSAAALSSTPFDASGESDGDVMEDEFDALTREMPEFRVPDDAGDEAPGAAILSVGRRAAAATETAHAPAARPQDEQPGQSEPGDADWVESEPAESDLGDTDPGEPQDSADSESYARERAYGAETLQLAAVSREEMERHYFREVLKEAVLLDDHRFSPDVLICPPRLLTTEWQDGGPLKRAALAAAHLDAELRETAPTDFTPDEVEPDEVERDEVERDEVQAPVDGFDEYGEFNEDDLPELDPDSVEIDLDELEAPDSSEAKPPPQPAGARAGAPPKLPASASPPPESELGGLVQEILDDSAAALQAAESDAPAEQSRQKKTRNRPRGPRETWFQKVFTDEYFRTLPSDIHRQTRREVDFIEASLNLQPDDLLLDLACGFGRHSIELARRGHGVVGLDLSMHMLQKALNEGQRQELSIKFIHGDMRDLQFDGVFSDCLLWQTSFGFFDDQTNFRVLRGIHRALRPDGELLIDVVNRDHIASRMPHRLWWEGVNCVFLEEVDLDHRTSVLHTKRSFIYEDGTPPLEQSFYIRLYSPHELRHLLHAAGFSVLELSGELHHRGQFLGAASTRVVMRAKKRAPSSGGAS